MKTLVVVQARVGSSRLPGKVLLSLAGAPLLLRMVERVRAAKSAFDLIVATTTEPSDEQIVALCRKHSIDCFRGHPVDLLDRHYQAARMCKAELVVKIPSDCPLIDPAVIDRVIAAYRPGMDYVSNLHPASYPDGNDVELMPLEALALAHREAKKPHEREHTTPFLWDQPERFRLHNVTWETGRNLSMSHRFTIDYIEDYAFLSAVYGELFGAGRIFNLEDILQLLQRRPDIFLLNSKYAGVNWYRHHLGELRTVRSSDTRRPEQQ